MNNTLIMPKTEVTADTGFDISRYTDFDFVRNKLIYKLINYERNREKLEFYPYRRFLDLAVTYCCTFKTPLGDNANIIVTKDHLKYWDITEIDLYELAALNTPRYFGGRIEPLLTAIKNISGLEDIPEDGEQEMFLCTNMEMFYGASTILYDDFLKKFASELGASLIILPSSVHEVILMPDRGGNDYSELLKIVEYVNKTEVADSEILSGNIYRYDLAQGSIGLIYPASQL